MAVTVNSERLLNTLMELCRITSPSGREEGVSDYIRTKLRTLGLEAETDETGNLYVSSASNPKQPLFLSSHMDTVPVPQGKEVRVIRKDGRICSDGSTILGGDDKQGVAAALEMLSLCRENPGLHRPLEVIFTVKEEVGSLGSGAVDPSRLKSRDGFNLDGETAPGSVIHRAPYKEKFICRVEGISSHAALAPLEGINAIVIASRIISRLPLGEPGPESTSNVGVIHSGIQTNVVPGRAVFEGELRSFKAAEFEEIRKDFIRICQEEAESSGGKADLEWIPCYKSYDVGPGENCSLWFLEACKKQNIKPEFVSSRGGGDSNQLNNKGLRNLVFGLGMHNIHSDDEYLIEEEYIRESDSWHR